MTAPSFDRTEIQGMSVAELVDKRARETPDKVFLIDPVTGATTTYGDLKTAASGIAAYIAAQGVETGDSVAYAMANGPRTVMTIIGILYGGYLATAINLVAGGETISYVLDHSGAKLVLADETGAGIVAEAAGKDAPHPPITRIDAAFQDGGEMSAYPRPAASADGLLMYTSGTTGRPKGVVLTHGNLLAGGGNTALAHHLSDADRGMCVLPLYHINGLCVTVMGALVSGSSLVMPPKFSVASFWPQIIEHRCTWFSVVPTQISYLLHGEGADISAALGNLRFGRSASSPLSPDVQETFERRFGVPIIETMGLTETAAQILSNPMPPGICKIGSPGIAFGNEIMIADTAQNEVARGTEGELLVRGPNVMRCYLKNPEATAQSITDDGWLRTGDLGLMDEDGYVFITGRLKELIIKGGENIAPREVDDALYSHPDVIEAAAFSRKCPRYGETVEAAVVMRAGSAATEAQLIALCADRIGPFKAPDHVHFCQELPKGPSGKIQRIKLAEMMR